MLFFLCICLLGKFFKKETDVYKHGSLKGYLSVSLALLKIALKTQKYCKQLLSSWLWYFFMHIHFKKQLKTPLHNFQEAARERGFVIRAHKSRVAI
jgi:hypothetical protein